MSNIKIDEQAIKLLCEKIKKKEGENAIYPIGRDNKPCPRWSTGIEDLDNITGGGFPVGRTVIIWGAPSAGKTTLLFYLMGLHEKALYMPVEKSLDKERAEMFNNVDDKLLIYEPEVGEQVMHRTINFAKTGIPIIGIDSIPSIIPSDDWEKVQKAANTDTIQEQRIGGTARLLDKYLPEIEKIIDHTGTTVIMLNQIRDRINALPFGEQTRLPGGHKVEHSGSLYLQVARKGWIEIPNKDPSNTAKTEKIGIIMKAKVTKSKVCSPLKECEIPLIYDRGFVAFDEIDGVRKELMEKRKEEFE